MPYIPNERRANLDPVAATPHEAQDAGELNFQLTRLAAEFVQRQGGNYAAINAAVGALECAKLELYRRKAAPYEDGKIQSNGDVY